MNEDLPVPDEIYVSPIPEIDFDKLMNLYGEGAEEEEKKKTRSFRIGLLSRLRFFFHNYSHYGVVC